MKERRIFNAVLVSAVLLTVMAIASERVYFSDFEYRYHTRRVNRIIAEKEKILDNCMTGLSLIMARGGSPQSVAESAIFSIARKHRITLLEYVDGKLFYWSDNSFNVPVMLNNSLFSDPVVFIQNGWFLTGSIEAGNEKIIGLLRISTEYGFENDLVKSGFEDVFRLPRNTLLGREQGDDEYNVFNRSGTFLFSLEFPSEKSNTYLILVPLLLWLAAFISAIILVLQIASVIAGTRGQIAGFIFSAVLFAAIYLVLLLTGRPEVIYRTGLFSPYIFSMGRIIPTLGHLLILSVFVSLTAARFCFRCALKREPSKSPAGDYILNVILYSASAILFVLVHRVFARLISDSNINFETYKVLKINFFTLAGFVSILLLITAPLLIVFKATREIKEGEKGIRISSALASVFIISAMLHNDIGSLIVVVLLFASAVFIMNRMVLSGVSFFNLPVMLSVILGLYSLFVISVNSANKINENLKVQAVSFSSDHDPVAEYMLIDMWTDIRSDSLLGNMMDVDYFQKTDYDSIFNYLRESYFGGYWGNFSFNIFLCNSQQSIQIGAGPGDDYENCFSFFEDRIRRNGNQLTGTEFWFIDNQGGRSNYLGRLCFGGGGRPLNCLFIELFSDINVFQPGYSELLLDRKFRGYAGLKDYSFAKYINGRIVLQNGEYAYNKDDVDYIDPLSDYRFFREEGFVHTLYRNGNATIIISRPSTGAGNLVVSFAYLFIFLFIFSNIIILFMRPPDFRAMFNLNFRQKLQASFTLILLGSFILAGVVVAFLTIRQYKSEHNKNIREKLGSVYLEIENNIGDEKYLSAEWRNASYGSLNNMLINLSNIFNTDINLYDLNGFLLATSRPEIYYRDLAARRMNILAFINLVDLNRSEYLQNEQLGSLDYVSAYVPFYNSDNRVLGYLNLPYFRMQSLLARQISNLIVTVINFTILIILLSMSFAVFISGRLTSPLLMLSRGLASVELGKKGNHLRYSGNDEIGELVRQYNQMLDELEESAGKLANSEREYAWREMAKQIAHEIKNPLTPMKLNVQQLLRSWRDGVPGFEKKLESFSRNQIEYIDNLSSIASAFSSFAKLPGTNPAVINLLEQMRLTLELFRNTANVTFKVRWPRESKIFIYADKEHLNGIFSNLFKNSIQAIPQGTAGVIKVSLETAGDKVLVTVGDNGSGIPPEIQEKLFTPNFTTKSSGMGLGLSIVKKYVEGANGRIWFRSDPGEGTEFNIEFPLMYTVERPGDNTDA